MFRWMLMIVFALPVACDVDPGPPPDRVRTWQQTDGKPVSEPTTDHERLRIDLETALREIELDCERLEIESETGRSATLAARLEQLRFLREKIKKLEADLEKAEETESVEFRNFRRDYERKLADWEAKVRALQQTLQRRRAEAPS